MSEQQQVDSFADAAASMLAAVQSQAGEVLNTLADDATRQRVAVAELQTLAVEAVRKLDEIKRSGEIMAEQQKKALQFADVTIHGEIQRAASHAGQALAESIIRGNATLFEEEAKQLIKKASTEAAAQVAKQASAVLLCCVALLGVVGGFVLSFVLR